MIQRTRNKQAITNPHILELIQECVTNTKDMGFSLPSSLRFLERKNTKRSAGTAFCIKKVIVLSNFIYKEKDDAIKSVIYHELGHIIAGVGAHHGPVWKKIVNKMTKTTGIKIPRLYDEKTLPVHAAEKAALAKFVFRCKKCGGIMYYYKRSRFTDTYDELNKLGKPRWTCTCCGGTFEKIK